MQVLNTLVKERTNYSVTITGGTDILTLLKVSRAGSSSRIIFDQIQTINTTTGHSFQDPFSTSSSCVVTVLFTNKLIQRVHMRFKWLYKTCVDSDLS